MTSGSGGARAPVVFVTHEATLTGAPVGLLQLLRWLRQHTDLDFELVLLEGGALTDRLAEVAPMRSVEELITGPPPEVLFLNSSFSARVLTAAPFEGSYVIARVPELGWAIDHVLPEATRRIWLDRSDRFIAVSERVRRLLIDEQGVPADRVVTIHGFIPSAEVRATAGAIEAARSRAGIPAGTSVVGAVGVRSWRKGVDLFVQVADVVRRRRPDRDVRFVWLGDGDGSRTHRAVGPDVTRAGLDRCVHLLPDHPEPAPTQAMMDVILSTSREDPFPRVCLEAAALARPIVAFDSGGVEELLAAAGVDVLDYGDVEGMADQVLALLDDPDRAAAEGGRLAEVVRTRHDLSVGAPAVLAEIQRGRERVARSVGGP